MSIVSHERELSRTGDCVRHTYWREDDDGTRQALYIVTVPEGQFVQVNSPDGSVERIMGAVAYEYWIDEQSAFGPGNGYSGHADPFVANHGVSPDARYMVFEEKPRRWVGRRRKT